MAVAADSLGFQHGSIQKPPAETTSVRLFLHRGRASNQLPRTGLVHAREPVISDTHVAETRQLYCAWLYFKDIWDTSMRARTGARPTCMLLAGWS